TIWLSKRTSTEPSLEGAQLLGHCRREAAGRAWLPAAEPRRAGVGGPVSASAAPAAQRRTANDGDVMSTVSLAPSTRTVVTARAMSSATRCEARRALGPYSAAQRADRITRVMRSAAPSDSGGRAQRQCRAVLIETASTRQAAPPAPEPPQHRDRASRGPLPAAPPDTPPV